MTMSPPLQLSYSELLWDYNPLEAYKDFLICGIVIQEAIKTITPTVYLES